MDARRGDLGRHRTPQSVGAAWI